MAPPTQKPGRSRQDYQTPPEFLISLRERLSIADFALDAAATYTNSVSSAYLDETINALHDDTSWISHQPGGWTYCNPPFGRVGPWVRKAWIEAGRGASIAMLLPAGVGSNWWRDYVDGRAHVLLLNGRLTFVGQTTPYPKDCVLLLYTPFIQGGYEVWDWRHEA